MYKDRDMFTRVIHDFNVNLWKWWMGSAEIEYILRVVGIQPTEIFILKFQIRM